MLKTSEEDWHYNNISWKKLGVIPLDEVTECCDTSCRDDVTLYNWK